MSDKGGSDGRGYWISSDLPQGRSNLNKKERWYEEDYFISQSIKIDNYNSGGKDDFVDPPLLRWGTTHPTRGIQLTLNGKKYVNGYDGGTDNSYDSDAKKKFRHHQQQQQQQQQQ